MSAEHDLHISVLKAFHCRGWRWKVEKKKKYCIFYIYTKQQQFPISSPAAIICRSVLEKSTIRLWWCQRFTILTSSCEDFFSLLWSVYNLPALRKLNPPCFHWLTKAQIQWCWNEGLALTLLQMTYQPYRSRDCRLLWVMSRGIVIWDGKVKWFSTDALRQQWQ